MADRPSLRDISHATGFAVSTVSMALRNHLKIPAATRRKINEAARTLGYFPNPLLAALASKRFGSDPHRGTPIVSFHLAVQFETDQPVLRKMLRAQQEHARKLGYRLEGWDQTAFRDGEHAARVFFARGIQGIILPPQFRNFPGMEWDRFSVVGWGDSPALARAAVDHFDTVTRAWQEARRRGYRRIGFALLNAQGNLMEDQVRLGAVLNCRKHTPRAQRIPPFSVANAHDHALDIASLVPWVRRYRPDAVIGFNNYVEWGLQQAGYRIPQDIAFASLHTEEDPSAPRTLSGMRDMRLSSILAAVELLDQQIRHHQYGLPREPRALLIKSEWIEGETLPQRG